MTTIRQLCPTCEKLFVVAEEPMRSPREIKREISCPECVAKLPGKQLADKFANKTPT